MFSTAAAAARGAEVVVTMLADGDVTKHAVADDHGTLDALTPGTIWVQMGTIGLEWTKRLAARAQETAPRSSTRLSPAATAPPMTGSW